MKKVACFPGSFDPFTKGHEDVVRKGLGLFDEVVIAVGVNSTKTSFFELEKRLNHIKSCFKEEKQIRIVTYSTLTTELCINEGCTHILRGLRDTKDYSYEMPIALLNRSMSGIETIFVLPDPIYIALNSSIIREIYKNGGKIDAFVTNVNELV